MPSRLGIFSPPEHAVHSLNVQARMGPEKRAERGQFKLLTGHFLERFFNNEIVGADDEAKTRLVQLACVTGLPGFVVALYLWVPYHDLLRRQRPYWAQVNDHYFYVLYSFVAMGIITVFEWDLFFPDLLDVFVLSSLPIKNRKLFLARIAAICIFIAGFLFDSNFLAPLVLPAAIDPPSVTRFLAAHLLAVTASGIFSAAFILALQGVILALCGERFFRSMSLFLQGCSITVLSLLLLLLPIQSQALSTLMHSKSELVLYFPPFWFLGIYERVMEGPAALSIYTRLAQTGCWAMLLIVTAAVLAYPLAYWRRTRGLIEGLGAHDTRNWAAKPINRMFHATVLRLPVRRAVYHFISQTLPRVQRYRIYLVMYGGVGVSLVIATILRLHVRHGDIGILFSPDGLQAAIPIVAFWTVAGLRTAFVSPVDQRGNWIFRIIRGRPGLDQLSAAKIWVLLWSAALTLAAVIALHMLAPATLESSRTVGDQLFVAIGLCLLLTDAFFLRVKTIPFTRHFAPARTGLVFGVVLYFGLFPALVWITLGCELWIEVSAGHLTIAILAIALAHLAMARSHGRIIREHVTLLDIDEDQEEFPQRLGLRY